MIRKILSKRYLGCLFRVLFVVLIPALGVISFYGLTHNFYISPLLFILFYFLSKEFAENNRSLSISYLPFILLSVLYSTLYTIGTRINQLEYKFFENFLIKDFLITSFWIYSFSVFVYYLIIKILKIFRKELSQKARLTDKRNIPYYLIFIFLFLSWVPYFVAFYPGLMSEDSLYQWCQSINQCPLTNHHPVVHTLFIRNFSSISLIFENPNLGVALYSLTQLLLMSAIFSYVIKYFSNKKTNKHIVTMSILFYALLPIFGIYGITMWKDVLFGCITLLFSVLVHKFLLNDLQKMDKKILFLSIIGVILFRSNGIYVSFVITILMLLLIKRRRVQILILFVLPLIVGIIIKYPVYNYFHIESGRYVENLGIPLRQVTGVVAQGLELDSESERFIKELIPKKIIIEKYTPSTIDFIKMDPNFNHDFLEANKKEFFVTWFRLLRKHPVTYTQIYLRSTYGFWYPEAQGYIIAPFNILENEFGLFSRDSQLKEVLIEYFVTFYNMPVLKYLMSDAFYLWVILFIIALIVFKKEYLMIFSILTPFLIFLTMMLATPIAYQPRYTFIMYCIFPFLLFLIGEILKTNRKTT